MTIPFEPQTTAELVVAAGGVLRRSACIVRVGGQAPRMGDA